MQNSVSAHGQGSGAGREIMQFACLAHSEYA